ncbi:MAG TPA: efflux RND transporter periplasmic adaptor subunit [Bryobacteraceae bacterium]|jgi:multidrug resistance efflux pump|nr:efflux RND transporter periplasmic adaptor subunit [Bryobacteraceae bacterium]
MKKSALRIAIGLAALCGIGFFVVRSVTTSPTVSAMRELTGDRRDADPVVVACPGRIEGRSDTIEVGAATDGIVQAVNVREGQLVQQGAVLAEIGCNDLRSSLQVAEAEAESVKQSRARLLRGSRPEEREAAAQRTQAARAEVEHSSAELNRATQLSAALAISKSSYDNALRDYDVAEAELKEASRNEELVNAGPTQEDLAKADADLRAAEERIKLAQEKVSKCVVSAPVRGTILRVDLRQGESFSTVAPHPLFTIADLSGRRVRAEVDERDISKVRVGQKAILTSEAYPNMHFIGHVERISSMMGRKTVDTGNPADKSDRDILEALVNLEPAAQELPMGLRVTVQFVR